MSIIGAGFHALRGDLQAATDDGFAQLADDFGWDGEDAIEVDLEDYHG